MVTTRERIHQLVDELSDHDLEEFVLLLERQQRAARLFNVLMSSPADDEEDSTEEAAAVAEAREDVAAGRVVDHREALRRLLEQEA